MDDKKRREPETKEITKVVPILAAAVLNSLQRTRELEATSFDTYLLEAKDPFSECLIAAGKSYAEEIELQGRRNHQCGPPHLWLWARAIPFLATCVAIGRANQSWMQAYAESEPFKARDQVSAHVRTFIAKKSYVDADTEEPMIRITLGVSLNDELRRTFHASLVQLGATFCQGKAPPSGLERSLQDFLEDLRG